LARQTHCLALAWQKFLWQCPPKRLGVFPKDKGAGLLGHLYLENGVVRAEIPAKAEVQHVSQLVKNLIILPQANLRPWCWAISRCAGSSSSAAQPLFWA
jgi:hypothetical protein